MSEDRKPADRDPNPERPRNPMEPPATPDGNPPRRRNPTVLPDITIEDPPPADGTPTPVETPNEDK